MSYKNEIELVKQELIDNFINELKIVRELIKLCSNKRELINKIEENNLYNAYYYIKNDDFATIMLKLNLLLTESEDK